MAPAVHPPRFQSQRRATDWAYLALLAAGAALLWKHYGARMDGGETLLLGASVPALAWLGWHWRALQVFLPAVALITLAGMAGAAGATGIDSTHATLGMCLLYGLSAAMHWLGMIGAQAPHNTAPDDTSGHASDGAADRSSDYASDYAPDRASAHTLGTALAWLGSALALSGLLLRWHESHALGAHSGHIPLSNLYEVLVLLCLLTTLMALYHAARWRVRSIAAFAMLPVAACSGFVLWYMFARQGHAIAPLVPALQSGWMKLHVPANIIGYAAFAVAAMAAFARLLQHHASAPQGHMSFRSWLYTLPLWLLGLALCISPWLLRPQAFSASSALSTFWLIYTGVAALLLAALLGARHRIAQRLPPAQVLDDIAHKAIATGFVFFTLATVLGALWAAQAWGSYWSWDPKEVWALIVWLHYAAWLHARLMRQTSSLLLAWWALAGLAVTSFAFLGVNLWFEGLHSYGGL